MTKSSKFLLKTFACFAAISIMLLACEDIGNNPENNPICNVSVIYMSSSSFYEWEEPVMDSRVKSYREPFGSGEPPPDDGEKLGYALGNYDGIDIHIITNKNMLMSAFPDITGNEQTECNYFAIVFSSAVLYRNHWILSQDMVLHYVTPVGLCPVNLIPYTETMLVCDDTAEGNLKDRIDIDSILSHADPNWRCSDIEDIIVDCK